MGQKPKKPRRTRQQKLVAILAAILALVLLLPMVFMILNYMGAGAASVDSIKGEISSLKDRNKSLSSQKADLQSQLNAIKANKSQAIGQKNLLEQQMGLVQEEIDNLDRQMEQYDLLIGEKEQEVAENEAREAAQFDLFCRQVRAMEKEGAVSYWSILFSASSFADLLERVNLVNSIEQYNDSVCKGLQAARAALQAAKTELEGAKEEAQEAKVLQEQAKEELAAQEREVQALINEIAGDEAQAQRALDKLEADAKAMDAEIAKKEKELQAAIEAAKKAASNQYQFDPGTGFYWPLPKERVSITSFFGPRTHPITGKYHNHSGTDIGAYSGTQIYAAHGGVVLTSAYSSSYGNYVVLSRGDGITTLYAHMSKRAVSVGQTVSQGQVIGYVGSTGSSTAPHLHFEVRVNGERQDALKYYPNVKWTNNTGFPYKS